jgi:hypothetical protein
MLGHSSTHLLMSTGSSRSETQDSSQGCTTSHYLHKVEVNGRPLSHLQKLNVPAISHHILGMLSIQPGNLILFLTLRLRSISTHISDITIFSCFVIRWRYLRLRGKSIRKAWHERDNVELIDIPFKNTTVCVFCCLTDAKSKSKVTTDAKSRSFVLRGNWGQRRKRRYHCRPYIVINKQLNNKQSDHVLI